MKKHSRFLKISLYTTLICIGVVIGLAVSQYIKLPSADTINIIDLATLVTTVFLAVYIPEVLDRKLQITRDKKELLEKRIVEIQTLYRKVNLLVQSNESISRGDFSVIESTLDAAKGKLDILVRLLSFSKLGTTFDYDLKKIRTLDREYREILLTDNSPENALIDRDKQSADIGRFRYEESIMASEEELYNKLDEATTLLIFKISDS